MKIWWLSIIKHEPMEIKLMREVCWTNRFDMTYSCHVEGFSFITLAIVHVPWTGRVCQGKQHNKERMNGRMKERKGWSLNRSDWQSVEEGDRNKALETCTWQCTDCRFLHITQRYQPVESDLTHSCSLKKEVAAVKHLTDGVTSG